MKNNKLKRFLEGVANISIFQSPIINPIAGKTDEELLRQDWFTVGQDIEKVLEVLNSPNEKNCRNAKVTHVR